MIRVIREDGIEILLNANLIQRIEEDTRRKAIIYLESGESVKIKTNVGDVIQKIKGFRQGFGEESREYDKAIEKELKEREKAQKDKEAKAKSEEKAKMEKEAKKQTLIESEDDQTKFIKPEPAPVKYEGDEQPPIVEETDKNDVNDSPNTPDKTKKNYNPDSYDDDDDDDDEDSDFDDEDENDENNEDDDYDDDDD